MSQLILSTRKLVILYFFDACWVLGFIFLSFAIPFVAAVQHSDFLNWPAWDKFMLLLTCSISSVTTIMALFKQLGKRIRAGQDLIDDDLIAVPKTTTETK